MEELCVFELYEILLKHELLEHSFEEFLKGRTVLG